MILIIMPAILSTLFQFPAGELMLFEPIHFHLDKAKLTTTLLSVFQWTQTNNTIVQQNVTRTEMHEISKQNTYEFRWESTSKIPGEYILKLLDKNINYRT